MFTIFPSFPTKFASPASAIRVRRVNAIAEQAPTFTPLQFPLPHQLHVRMSEFCLVIAPIQEIALCIFFLLREFCLSRIAANCYHS